MPVAVAGLGSPEGQRGKLGKFWCSGDAQSNEIGGPKRLKRQIGALDRDRRTWRSGSSLEETLTRGGYSEQGRPDHQRHLVFSHGSRLLLTD